MFNINVRKPSILKSVDEFILPFILLVAARYLGVFITGFISPMQLKIGLESSLFSVPFIQFPTISSLVLANSVSWLLTGAIIGIVFGFIAFRNMYLNEDWLHPKEAAAFHGKKMEHFIVSTHEAFHQSISWSIVTFIALAFVLVDFLLGNLLIFSFGIIISITSLLSATFVLSVARSVSLDRKEV